MATQKQLVAFDWTGAQQAKQDRKLHPGELVELINVRRTEEGPGPIRKRLGLDKTTVSTFKFDTFTGPPTEYLCSEDTVFVRDTTEKIWLVDPDVPSEATFRATLPRAFPTYTEVGSQAGNGKGCKPVTVLHGTEIWIVYIAGASSGSASSATIGLHVMDATTKIVKFHLTTNATNIATIAAASDGSNVWVFTAPATGNTITARKYHSTTGLVSSATYATPSFGASPIITGLYARKHASLSQIVLTAIAYDSAPSPRVNYNYHSYLDAATGQVDASPAAVLESQNGNTASTDVQCMCGLEVANSTGSNGFFYYSFWREKPAATDVIEAIRVKVNATTLATDSKTVLKEYSTGNVAAAIGTTAGHFDGTNEVYVSSFVMGDIGAVQTTPLEQNSYTERHTYNGTSTTSTLIQKASYVAGGWWQIGTSWFVLLGFDDGFTRGAQRSYYIMRSDGFTPSSALYGSASFMFHAGGFAGTYSLTVRHRYQANSSHVAYVVAVDSNNVALAVMGAGPSFEDTIPTLINVNHAETFHSTAPGILTGGVPVYFSRKAIPFDLSPMQAPFDDVTILTNGGTAYSVNRVSYRYCYIGDDGKRYRSDSSTPQTLTFNTTPAPIFTLLVPSLRWQYCFGFASVPENAYIELYGSVNGGTDMFLQGTYKNSIFTDTTQITVFPIQWTATGELLDTTGGALGPSPLPPCRLAVVHKNRTWLAGTDTDEIWPSLEHRQGRGPEFNEALILEWQRGTGTVQAIAPVDDDTLALFRQDAIGLVTGPGPDGLGNGAFDVRTLPGKDGCSNPKACIQGPLGVYFQRHADGRMCLLTVGGIQEIHQGMEDYTGYTFTGAVDVKAKRELRFYASNGKILVLDYGHPTPDQPWGQWVLHENSNLPAWVGARLINGEPVALEPGTSSVLRTWKPGSGFTDDGTSIAMSFTTGRMAPAGMMGEFDAIKFTISTKRLGSSSVTHTITVYNDQDATETHTYTDDGTDDFEFWSAVNRTRDVKLKIQETTVNSEQGRQWDGVVMEVGLYGRIANQRKKVA